jgi:hypothetical protein
MASPKMMPQQMSMEPPPQAPGSPSAGQSEERTPDSAQTPPEAQQQKQQYSEKVKKALIEIVDKYVLEWNMPRRRRVRQIMRAHEYLKGNQYISFDPYQFVYYDPLEAVYEGNTEDEDLGIYRYCTNFYQMGCLSFIAALGTKVPKTAYMPNNAEKEEDVATANAGSTLQAIIERKNKIRALLRRELMLLWTDGIYFKYTRFVVDGNRAGYTKVPVDIQYQNHQVFPDRYVCPSCDYETPAQNMAMLGSDQAICEKCGQPLSQANFFAGESVQIPQVTEYKDEPNGMVAQTVYGLLNITVQPSVGQVHESPILKLDEEVDTAAIRASYPEAWEDAAQTSEQEDAEQANERLSRQIVLNAAGGRNNLTAYMMPTLSRTWINDWAFNKLDDKAMAAELKQLFPDGCFMTHLGKKFLEARSEKMGEKWTCGKTLDQGTMHPLAAGEACLDVQDQINDTSNIIQEHADRNASPETYMDEEIVDTRALNGKPVLPGTIVGIKRRADQMNRPLADFMFQRKVQMDGNLYERPMKLFEIFQLLSGIMPQTFGGQQTDIQTATGQKQALNTAVGRLAMFLENVREEHADASERAVRCAANNYQEDVMDVVSSGDKDFRNRYVRLRDLGGEFHAYPETDPGIPATYQEIQDRLMQLFLNPKNPWAAECMELPVNQKIVAQYLGPPGMVIPGDAARAKTLRTINKLLEGAPRQQLRPGPMGPNGAPGQPMAISIPSILPDPDFEDFSMAEDTIKQWAEENYEVAYENPNGFENVRAYYKLCVMGAQQKAAQEAALTAQTAPASPGSGGDGAPGAGGGSQGAPAQ